MNQNVVTEPCIRCSGCGIELQSVDVDAPGYVPTGAMHLESPVCRRCFRIKNYGEFSRVVVADEAYEREVSKIAEKPGLVFYVLDVFDLPGSLIARLPKLIGRSPVVAVVNKVDLLPREVRVEALERWIRRELESTGVRPEHVLFVSAQTKRGIDEVIETLEDRASERAYVVGMANVGKSTLLNQLVYRLMQNEPFTASRVPGTTIGMVSTAVTLSSGRTVDVIDTPGLIHGDRIIDKLCGDCLKVATPQSMLKPRVYQLNAGQSLWLGGFCRFDFLSGPHQPVVCYVSNQLVVHRTKLEKAEHIGREHADDILKTPCPSCRLALAEFETYHITSRATPSEITPNAVLQVPYSGCDIVLSGLGWITLSGKGIEGEIHVPQNIQVSLRPRMIGQLSRGGRA